MVWNEIERPSFIYYNKKVTRRKVVSETIFGDFEVFEAVNGACFVRHPFLKSNYVNPLTGFYNGLEDWFGKSKVPCSNMEEGIEACEKVMTRLKEVVSNY